MNKAISYILVLLVSLSLAYGQKTGVGGEAHARFDIHIPASSTDSSFAITLNNTSFFLVGTNGSVAINKWVPVRTLDVNGSVKFRSLSGSNNALVIADNAGMLYRLSATGSSTDVLNGNLQWAGSSTSGYLWLYNTDQFGVGYIFPSTLQTIDTPYFSEYGTLDLGFSLSGIGLGIRGAVWQQASPTQTGVIIGENAGASDNGSNNGNIYIGIAAGELLTNAGYNTAIGYNSLNGGAGTVSCNTAVGSHSLFNFSSGSGNVALGYKSGYNLTSGDDNIIIGDSALFSCNTCTGNIAIGKEALVNVNNSSYNIGIGSGALSSASGLSYMIGIGAGALSNLTSISPTVSTAMEVAIGDSALANISEAGRNTAVGLKTGSNLSVSLYTTIVGSKAMYKTKISENNTVVGSEAASLTDTMFDNVAIGYRAIYKAQRASYNTVIGVRAGANAKEWFYNIAIGYYALNNDTIGTRNIAIGNSALYFSRSSKNNINIGHESGYNVTTGGNNVAIGYRTLFNARGTYNNVAIGNFALSNLQNGFPSTAIGDSALASLTDAGALNVAVGKSAMAKCTSCLASVAIGSKAMYHATSSANNNVAIGTSALFTGTTNKQNVAIGNYAMAGDIIPSTTTNHYNSVAIGHDALRASNSDTETVAIGYGAGDSLEKSFQSLFIGYRAGQGFNQSYHSEKDVFITNRRYASTPFAPTSSKNVVIAGAEWRDTISLGNFTGNVILGIEHLHDYHMYNGSPISYNTIIGHRNIWQFDSTVRENVAIGLFTGMVPATLSTGEAMEQNVMIGTKFKTNYVKKISNNTVIGFDIKELTYMDVFIGSNINYYYSDNFPPHSLRNYDSFRVAIGFLGEGLGLCDDPSIYTPIGRFSTVIVLMYDECFIQDLNNLTFIGNTTNSIAFRNNSGVSIGFELSASEIPAYTGDVRIGNKSTFYGNANVNVQFPVVVGYNAYGLGSDPIDTTTDYAYNSIVFGAYARNPSVGTVYDYTIGLGDSNVTWIGGQVNWSTYSDKRFKTEIKEDVVGLEFINKLRPVTYKYNFEFSQYPSSKLISPKWQRRWTGFLAQQVQRAAHASNYKFSGVIKGKTYHIRYAEFVVPLVKAVQEQQVQIEEGKIKAEQIKSQLKELEEQLIEQQYILKTLNTDN